MQTSSNSSECKPLLTLDELCVRPKNGNCNFNKLVQHSGEKSSQTDKWCRELAEWSAQNLPFQQILPTLDFFYIMDCLIITGLDRTYHAHSSFLADR